MGPVCLCNCWAEHRRSVSESVDAENESTRAILAEHVRVGDWDLSRPRNGRGIGTYLTQLGSDTVFVKWDVDGGILRRLSDLGVAPPVVASGDYNGRPFAIQRWLQVRH